MPPVRLNLESSTLPLSNRAPHGFDLVPYINLFRAAHFTKADPFITVIYGLALEHEYINGNVQQSVDFEMMKNIATYLWVNILLNLCKSNDQTLLFNALTITRSLYNKTIILEWGTYNMCG